MARRQPDPRRLRAASAAFIVVLLVVGVGIVAVLGGGGGAPAATPTNAAALTPSPPPTKPGSSATASASAIGSPTNDPSPSATPTGTATGPSQPPVATSTPSPTPAEVTPTPMAAGPRRELLFDRLGIDNIAAPEAMARLISFDVDGPGEITVSLLRLSVARVTMCLWQGTLDSQTPADQCRVMDDGTLTRSAPAGRTTWTASIIGAQPGRSPWARVRLRFPAVEPTVRLAQFRFQGLPNPDYNGLTAQLTAAGAGELRLAVAWDDDAGGAYPYRLRVDDLSAPLAEPYFSEGRAAGFDVAVDVEADHDYLIFFENRSENFHERVIFTATLAWP